MAYLTVIVALVVLVVLHELGHFLAARAVGIRATKFYVFFPPAVLKRTIGGVEYGIGAIPAGGFVKLPGMFEPTSEDVARRLGWDADVLQPVLDDDARLQLQAERRRILTAASADELVEPLTVIEGELARIVATASDSDARRTAERSRRRVSAFLDDLHPKAYWRAALWRRMTVIAAGPLVNLVVAFAMLATFYAAFVPDVRIDGAISFTGIIPNSPAERAGLTAKSRVVGFNGPIDGLRRQELVDRYVAARGKPITVAWKDDAGDSTVTTRTITPQRIDGDTIIGVRGLKAPDVRREGYVDVPVSRAMRVTLVEMRDVTWGNLSHLPRVFFDRDSRKEVGSVVGIVQTAEVVDRAGQLLRYVGIISLILAVMNVLPLLPLDGGHLLFGIVEAVRRAPLPRAAFERYSLVGIALVLLLFFIGLDNDIGRIRG